MSKAKKTTLLIVAALLILGGIAAIIYAVAYGIKNDSQDSLNTDETSGIQHEDVEYIYDNNGNVKSEIYYKDNKYVGRKDFFSEKNKQYVTELDNEGNEVFSSVTELNAAGSISLITKYENKELTETVEYVYYDDMRTLRKKTTKTFEGDNEYAEKVLYSEDGQKIQVSKYENGALIEETLFEENGGDAGVN